MTNLNVLCCAALFCVVGFFSVLLGSVLHCSALRCSVLFGVVRFCWVLTIVAMLLELLLELVGGETGGLTYAEPGQNIGRGLGVCVLHPGWKEGTLR